MTRPAGFTPLASPTSEPPHVFTSSWTHPHANLNRSDVARLNQHHGHWDDSDPAVGIMITRPGSEMTPPCSCSGYRESNWWSLAPRRGVITFKPEPARTNDHGGSAVRKFSLVSPLDVVLHLDTDSQCENIAVLGDH